MSGISLNAGSTILTTAILATTALATALLITGCDDANQASNSKNAENQPTAVSRTTNREPVQEYKRNPTTDSESRALSQDKASADNLEKQSAGTKPAYDGIAKPIGDNQSVDRIGATVTSSETRSTVPDNTATREIRDANTSTSDKPRAVDNSGQNEIDKQGTSMTPMDQGNSDADIAVTRTIRKALTGDSTLSTNAQNLKVITRDGVVVLRGPVASQAESEAVLNHARTAAGANRIENQIAVPTP